MNNREMCTVERLAGEIDQALRVEIEQAIIDGKTADQVFRWIYGITATKHGMGIAPTHVVVLRAEAYLIKHHGYTEVQAMMVMYPLLFKRR